MHFGFLETIRSYFVPNIKSFIKKKSPENHYYNSLDIIWLPYDLSPTQVKFLLWISSIFDAMNF